MTRQHSRLHKEQDRRIEASEECAAQNAKLPLSPRHPLPSAHFDPRSLATHIHTKHTYISTLRMPFWPWGCGSEWDKRSARADRAAAGGFAVAALPVELMHSQEKFKAERISRWLHSPRSLFRLQPLHTHSRVQGNGTRG